MVSLEEVAKIRLSVLEQLGHELAEAAERDQAVVAAALGWTTHQAEVADIWHRNKSVSAPDV